MLNVPSLPEMLTVIGVALVATVALVLLLGSLLTRSQVRSSGGPAIGRAQVPAQRSSSRPTPVASR